MSINKKVNLIMLATYTFNSNYQPAASNGNRMPSLRLLEGGKYFPQEFSPVLLNEYDQVRLKFFRWGLVPSWADSANEGKNHLFASSNHVFSHVAYQVPVKTSRCLIPADGYYIETGSQHNKQTFKVSFPDNRTFCFAGIADSWRDHDGSLLQTFSMLTTKSNSRLETFGLQMPFILPRNLEQIWLDPATPAGHISRILSSQPNHSLTVQKVQELVETQEFGRFEQVAA